MLTSVVFSETEKIFRTRGAFGKTKQNSTNNKLNVLPICLKIFQKLFKGVLDLVISSEIKDERSYLHSPSHYNSFLHNSPFTITSSRITIIRRDGKFYASVSRKIPGYVAGKSK